MKLKWIVTGVGIWLLGAVFVWNGGIGQGELFRKLPGVAQAEKASEETQKKINEANDAVQQLQQEKRRLQSDLGEIEAKKDNLQVYIQTLDSKMTELSKQMEETQTNIDTLVSEISVLEAKEQKVTEEMNHQYAMMKTRIKCIYEGSDDGYLELLLGSASLSDLYNRIEYVNKMNDYDNNMLKDYKNTKARLEATQQEKQTKMESLQTKKETLTFEKKSVKQLLDKKTSQLKEYNSLIDQQESELDNYNAEISEKSKELENLLAQQRREIAAEEAAAAAAARAAQNKNNNNNSDDSDDSSEVPPTTVNASGFAWPLAAAGRISCGFGPRKAPTAGASTYHKGIDIAVPTGTSVRASKAGKVVIATYSSSAGNYVGLYHGNGVYTYYMHCSSLSVSVGQQVEQGQTVALSGSTGISTGPHLHFAININGQYVNPLGYVSR